MGAKDNADRFVDRLWQPLVTHSVLTCLLKCTNDWYLNSETSEYTAVTFIDLKKAFDTVNHDILVQKLEHYGDRNKEIRWFHSYLTNR